MTSPSDGEDPLFQALMDINCPDAARNEPTAIQHYREFAAELRAALLAVGARIVFGDEPDGFNAGVESAAAITICERILKEYESLPSATAANIRYGIQKCLSALKSDQIADAILALRRPRAPAKPETGPAADSREG